jgi:hypothetical protein
MTGVIKDNTGRSSGLVKAVEDESGLSWQSVVTGSTLTAVAGRGYWINTTSNTCTITLPASASIGDELVFSDYARTWGTNKIIIDSNGLNYQGEDDAFTVEYSTNGQTLNIVYSDATKGWIPLDDDDSANVPLAPQTQRAIFAFGLIGSTDQNISNVVNSSGVVGSDVTGVGTARRHAAGATYGGDKAIYSFGTNSASGRVSITNLVNTVGVVASDISGVGTVRYNLGSAKYGGDKAIMAFGNVAVGGTTVLRNLISNAGVIAADAAGAGTKRSRIRAVGYGTDKAIFYGGHAASASSGTNLSNLCSNTGVVAADTTGVGTARYELAASSYGSNGEALFAYGSTDSNVNIRNLVSNVGVIASDASGAGTARQQLGGCGFGGDKGIFGFGHISSETGVTNLVSNSGVVASDTSAVGTARSSISGAGINFTA